MLHPNHTQSPFASFGTHGPRVWFFAVCAALLLPLTGCDWTLAQNVGRQGVLDLSEFGAQDDSWHLRGGEIAQWSLPCDTTGRSCALDLTVPAGRVASLRRKVRWDAESNPVIRWTWSVPQKLDSSSVGRGRTQQIDAVVALDVTLASSFGFSKTVRYVWSARRDRGRTLLGDNLHPKALVLRDARDMGRVVTDSVNVWEDFRRTFGYTPRHLALSIAVSARSNRPDQPVNVRFGPIYALPEAK